MLDLPELIRRIVSYDDRGSELVTASLTLPARLVAAADTVTEPLGRAELLASIARALPN